MVTTYRSGQGPATIPQSHRPLHCARRLEALFHDTFFRCHATRLEGGAEEPFYQAGPPHCIRYTRDYFRSALHEVAHWCVAGPQRRRLDDYGYWYAPDGRDAQQQAGFMRVEVLPQAYEALFCAACDHPFRVSLDNLDGEAGDAAAFADAVRTRALERVGRGLPERPALWISALWQACRGEPLLPKALQSTASGPEKVRLAEALVPVFPSSAHHGAWPDESRW